MQGWRNHSGTSSAFALGVVLTSSTVKNILSLRFGIALLCALLFASCNRKQAKTPPDHPRLTPKVVRHDVTFHSLALKRDMPYRVVLSANIVPGQKLPVAYLLHGGGGGFRDWTNDSAVAGFAEQERSLLCRRVTPPTTPTPPSDLKTAMKTTLSKI
jgi:acetyl esterase/lipase